MQGFFNFAVSTAMVLTIIDLQQKSGPSNKARGDPLPPPLPVNPSSAKVTCRRAALSVTPIAVPSDVDTLTRPQLLTRVVKEANANMSLKNENKSLMQEVGLLEVHKRCDVPMKQDSVWWKLESMG
eukprot:11992946-Ditylum_brightwellii.AAC.1